MTRLTRAELMDLMRRLVESLGDGGLSRTLCIEAERALKAEYAALAEHADSATPVVESDESNAVWRAYANRELSEDEAKAKLAALEAKSAALAEHDTPVVEWRPSDQRVFLDGVSLRIVLHTDGLWVWSVYWPLSHRTQQGRVATEAEAKQAAIAAAKEKK